LISTSGADVRKKLFFEGTDAGVHGFEFGFDAEE
jgi:hypothetical protein